MVRMMMIRRFREVTRRSYRTARTTRRDFSTLPSVETGEGVWNSFAMGCKVAITGLACVARYASAPYIRPLENEELKDCVLEKEIDLLTITQLLNIAQVHLRLKESIEEAESDMKTLKEIHDGSKTRA